MDAYVSKPVRAVDLFGAIATAVPNALRPQTPSSPTSPLPAPVTPTKPMSSMAAGSDGARRKQKPPGGSDGQTGDVLNWELALEATQVGDEALRELAAVFLRESPQLLEELHTALEQRDAARVRRCAHSLKGSAAIFAAQPTAAAAAYLESLGKEGKLDLAATALEQLEHEYNRLAPALAAHTPLEESGTAET